MKLFVAKVKHENYTAEYRQWAIDEKDAYNKIYAMCGIPNIKVKEI